MAPRQTPLLAILALVLAVTPAARGADKLPMVGWLEKVNIESTRLSIVAKVDTGADYSSLDTRRIRGFERDGEPWVAFAVVDDRGESLELERQVFRYATIDRAGGDKQRRPVVLLGICMGAVYREVQVNLVDRSTLEHRMLIGRDFLQGRYAVDSARTYITTPSCPQTRAR